MATAGSIVVSLLMNTGSFETDTKRAEGIAKKRAAAIDKAFTDMGEKIAIAGTVVGGALVAMIASTAASAKEISNLAQLSGAGAEEFQRFAAGAKSVGIEQGKLGDIFKDFREKVGEFVSTGGGGMKDFFEQVAPQVGITAEAFRNLSGPQAMQLYVDSLEKANLTQEQMSFYLESMASDTTALIPLLRSGGAEMKVLGDEAARVGRVMSDESVAAAKLLAENMQALQNTMVGAKNEMALELIPTLNNIVGAFSGAENGAVSMAKFLGGGLRTTLEATTVLAMNVAFVMNTLGDSIGAYAAVSARLFAGDIAGAKAIGEAYREASEARRKALDTAEQRVMGQGVVPAPNVRGAGFIDPRIVRGDPNPKPPKPPAGAKPAAARAPAYTDPLAESAQAYAAAMEAINKAQLSALMSGEKLTATQSALVDLFVSPEFLAMPDEWKRGIAEAGEYALQAEKVAEQQARLNELLTDSALEKQREDMALLAQAFEVGAITADQFGAAVHRALGIEGAGGEAQGSYWEQWLESAEKAMGSFDELAASVANNFSSQFGSAFESVVFDSESMGDAIHDLTEGMMRAVVNALGQMAAQWLAYQAVQMLVGKTAATSAASATAIEAQAMATMAGLNAFASTAAIPIVGPVLAPAAMAAAMAVTVPMAATIAGLSAAAAGARASGGPVTGSTPYLVGERGAELFVPNTSGSIVPNHKLGGGNVTVNVIEDQRRAGQTEERTNNGAREVDVFVADIMGDGPRARAMKQAFGLQRRGY